MWLYSSHSCPAVRCPLTFPQTQEHWLTEWNRHLTLGTLTLASLGSNSVILGPAENEMSPSGLIREMRGCPRPCHCLFILGPGNSHSYYFKCQHYIFIFFHGALFNEHCWLLNRQSILFKAPHLQRIFSLSVLIIVKVFLKVFNHSFSCSSTYYIYRHCAGFTHIVPFNPHDNPVMWGRLFPFYG